MDAENNLLPIKFRWNEWVGAVGDIGTLAPIFLSLASLNGLDLTRSLTMAGLLYMAAALYFRVPMPVQPLKAMAAIALASGFKMTVIWAAAVLIGGALLVLSLTGGTERLAKIFPPMVVKGVQFGVGLMLVKAGCKLLAQPFRLPHVPEIWAVHALSPRDFWMGFWFMVIPQLPLTLGNSVYACADAAENYFGNYARRVKPKSLTLSLGLTNVLAGLMGAYPLCHGSGGLTAHYRFGARTAGAGILMGSLCVLLAFFMGSRSYEILLLIPAWILGVMLLYIGLAHCYLLKALAGFRNRLGAVLGALVGAAFNNLAYTLAFVWVWQWGGVLLEKRRSTVSGVVA